MRIEKSPSWAWAFFCAVVSYVLIIIFLFIVIIYASCVYRYKHSMCKNLLPYVVDSAIKHSVKKSTFSYLFVSIFVQKLFTPSCMPVAILTLFNQIKCLKSKKINLYGSTPIWHI